ncbi:hypothetical protein HRS9122_09485 [Pyrenophora teres f. teres]|nr:hypothetical protein HRS9122_09485 [Pyrenophora teres f. teres]
MSPMNRKDSLTGTTSHRSSDMGGMDNEDLTKDVNTEFGKLGLDDEHAEKKSKGESEDTIPDSKDEPIWNKKIWLACKTGGVKEVEEYLQDAERSSLLTRGRDEDGNTALIIASLAPEKHSTSTAIMHLLLKAGAKINATNSKGRTALMQASLWGRLRAVEVLLERNIPANTELRDLEGLKAIDLASENEQKSKERYHESFKNGNVEKPWIDARYRMRIVQLLLYRHKGSVSQLQARLRETEDKMKKLEAELDASRVANRKVQGELSTKQDELDQANALCAKHVEKIAVTEKKLDEARVQIDDLTRRNADKVIKFREHKLDNETQIDFTKTFHIPSSFNDWTGERRKTTISYMELDGNHYFAKNGTHSGLNGNFISSKVYAPKAYELFKVLGSERDLSWFKHAEPQLMALYVEHFLESRGLSQLDFKRLKDRKPRGDNSECEEVRIFVNREVCGMCEQIRSFINMCSKYYGFQFVLEDASV